MSSAIEGFEPLTATEVRTAARVVQDTQGALILAHAYLAAYAIEKSASGALDFTDLIEKTRDLVASRPMAAWVLYKLDGGIDHILVDGRLTATEFAAFEVPGTDHLGVQAVIAGT